MTNIIHHLTFILVVVGAINWGLVGAFDYNLVTHLFGSMPMIEKGIYIAVGVAGVYQLYIGYLAKTFAK